LTELVHGPDGLRTAEQATEIFFGAEIGELTDAQLAGIFADVPSKELPRESLSGAGLGIIDALVLSGLCKNKSDARRVITQGGAYVNNRRVDGLQAQVAESDVVDGRIVVLKSGKKSQDCDFSGSSRPEEGDKFPLMNLKIHIGKYCHPLVAERHMFQLQGNPVVSDRVLVHQFLVA